MTVLDWALLLIVAASALLGLLRGLVGIAVSLAAWLLAGLAAYLFGAEVGRSLSHSQPGWAEYLGGYALSFIVVWMVVALLGLLVRRLVHTSGLSGMDRALGFGLGVARGVLFACVFLLMLGMTRVPGKAVWRDSSGVAMLLPGVKWLRDWMPPAMAHRVDLEGRGGSLQEAVQSQAQELKQALPHGLPASLGEPLPDAVPETVSSFTQGPPSTTLQRVPGGAGDASGSATTDRQPVQ